jgi:hypothetical protein
LLDRPAHIAADVVGEDRKVPHRDEGIHFAKVEEIDYADPARAHVVNLVARDE